jgi:hypothetical protein
MKSAWPIVMGFLAVLYAAVQYDAHNAAAASNASPSDFSGASAALVTGR